MPRPVHFEMSAEDPDATGAFYSEVFGWTVNKWASGEGGPAYWLVSTGEAGPGIDGGFNQRSEHSFPGTTITIGVDDLDASIAAVEGAGGKVVWPKAEIPNVGYLAYATDLAGNVFGMLEPIIGEG